MKLKDSFITHKTGNEHILISTDTDAFSGLVRSNETAAFIIHQLEKETTPEAILEALKEEYSGDEAVMSEDIRKVLKVLSEIGALDE